VTAHEGRAALRPAPVRAFWCRVPSRGNFGDRLTPWLIRRITGRLPVFTAPADPRPKFLVAGSVIGVAGAACTVWGTGAMSSHDTVSPDAAVTAVRGPLTATRVRDGGQDCPDVYGDPALLLPRLLDPAAGRRSGVGLAPHYSDLPRLAPRWGCSTEVRLIDLQEPVERVVAALTSCELVLCSSLHAIIACHAYRIPAVWIEFRALPSGDRTKFHDHQLAVDLDPQPPVLVGDDDLDVDGLARWAQLPAPFDSTPLWGACPFWTTT
jgi:pyruvyltransferase